MRNISYFINKKITIVGLGRSGLACANLLYDLGAEVSVTDSRDNEVTGLAASYLKSKNIKVELGKHSQEFTRERDLVIISPGVTDDAPPVAWANQFNIPVISEIEFAWSLCPAQVCAVSGSCGKTTVTTLIGKILAAKGEKVFTCGNIGNPFSGEVHKMKAGDFVSLEISSFQLEKIKTFKPKISVLLNFSRNHLDRYRDMQEYLQAKKRIFMNQDKGDYLVLNYADPVLRGLAGESKSQAVFFNSEPGLNPNQTAVLAVASILGVDKKICLDVFRDFKGIEHRLERVAEINNVVFINDSKATTVESAIWALQNTVWPIILIAGGKDKGVDYSLVLPLLQNKVKQLILIGEAREKIKKALRGFSPIEEAPDLQEAARLAFSKAKTGDCVLLSPMCSSFDMFSNYEERGRVFKQAVYELRQNAKA